MMRHRTAKALTMSIAASEAFAPSGGDIANLCKKILLLNCSSYIPSQEGRGERAA